MKNQYIYEILIEIIEEYLSIKERQEILENMPIKDDWGDWYGKHYRNNFNVFNIMASNRNYVLD